MPATLPLLLLIAQVPTPGPSILAPDATLATEVSGLERTGATASVVDVAGQAFARARRVEIGRASTETNATQLSLFTARPVTKGDVLLVSVWLRGGRKDGKPGRAELLFERATDPWTKSTTQGVALSDRWEETVVPFRAAESYAPGAAMLSVRLAFGPQTVEIGPASVVSYGPGASLDALVTLAAARKPLGTVTVALDRAHPRQTMLGFGGNFTRPRYGAEVPLDSVGEANLRDLRVVHARTGLPLERWAPTPDGRYKDEGPAHAALLALGELARKGIPTTVSVWEGPEWMLGGTKESMGRVLDPAKYDACIDAIGAYLLRAKEVYGARVETLSFNEPDYGVNFKFTPETMAAFVRRAGPRFRRLGLDVRFLVGDTAGGVAAQAFDTPLLQDPTLRPYLGPISFHCWDVLGATDESYSAIADLGRRFGKPVWCLEAGHDAQLWQADQPWNTWDNALRTAMAYERTLRLARPSVMDYWTYEDDFPIQ